MFTLFQNKKFESLDSPPPHQHPRHLGYQFNTNDLATTAGSTKTNGAHLGTPHQEVIYPPGNEKTYPTKTGSWVEIIIDSKNGGIFLLDGRYVSFGGWLNPVFFPVELHQSPARGWFKPKKSLVCKPRLASSLRERIFGVIFSNKKSAEKNSFQKVPKSSLLAVGLKTSCRWSLDNCELMKKPRLVRANTIYYPNSFRGKIDGLVPGGLESD